MVAEISKKDIPMPGGRIGDGWNGFLGSLITIEAMVAEISKKDIPMPGGRIGDGWNGFLGPLITIEAMVAETPKKDIPMPPMPDGGIADGKVNRVDF